MFSIKKQDAVNHYYENFSKGDRVSPAQLKQLRRDFDRHFGWLHQAEKRKHK